MDRKNCDDMNINVEDYSTDKLLDFLNESDTYFIKDDKSGIIGNKKTGVMIDKRTGQKIFDSKNRDSLEIKNYLGNIKYDFLDCKSSIKSLNTSDLKIFEDNSNNSSNNSEKENDISNLNPFENNLKNSNLSRDNLRRLLLNRARKVSKKPSDIEIESSLNKNKNLNLSESKDISNENLSDNSKKLTEDKEEIIDKNISLEINKKEDELISDNIGSDEELLKKINSKFNNVENEISDIKIEDSHLNDYNFYSFEEFENLNSDMESSKNAAIEVKSEKKKINELDKFKTIMDFEDYLLIMKSDEEILKSPFSDEKIEVPKVVVKEDEEGDSFNPFDTLFEVEEIENHDVNNENAIEEGMLPEFNLNQTMSKKVSIREVIKNKQKKKQDKKEMQEKLFFETLDERIEQFKNFKENSIDSQGVLNAINMDLNKINSSIKVEFNNLNKRRNVRSKDGSYKKTLNSKDDKFSLQNLLEEIYEEKGEEAKGLDTNELDIDAIKKDLSNNENTKQIVN